MKKVLLVIAVVAMFGAVGCSKKKNCTCVTTVDGEVVQTMDYETKEDCASLEINQGVGEMQSTMKCSEK